MILPMHGRIVRNFVLMITMLVGSALLTGGAEAQVTAFKQAVAEAAAKDRDIAAFYKANNYEGIWTTKSGQDRRRRQALFKAIQDSDTHGLPTARYDAEGLKARLKAAKSPRDRGFAEVELSRTFLQLARDMQTGAIIPAQDRQRYQTPGSLPRTGFLSGQFSQKQSKWVFSGIATQVQRIFQTNERKTSA